MQVQLNFGEVCRDSGLYDYRIIGLKEMIDYNCGQAGAAALPRAGAAVRAAGLNWLKPDATSVESGRRAVVVE